MRMCRTCMSLCQPFWSAVTTYTKKRHAKRNLRISSTQTIWSLNKKKIRLSILLCESIRMQAIANVLLICMDHYACMSDRKLILILKTRWPMEMNLNFSKLSPSALLMWQEQWLTVFGLIFKQQLREFWLPLKTTRFSLGKSVCSSSLDEILMVLRIRVQFTTVIQWSPL